MNSVSKVDTHIRTIVRSGIVDENRNRISAAHCRHVARERGCRLETVRLEASKPNTKKGIRIFDYTHGEPRNALVFGCRLIGVMADAESASFSRMYGRGQKNLR